MGAALNAGSMAATAENGGQNGARRCGRMPKETACVLSSDDKQFQIAVHNGKRQSDASADCLFPLRECTESPISS